MVYVIIVSINFTLSFLTFQPAFWVRLSIIIYELEYIKERTKNNEELKQFIEMCFEPNSPMNDRLKQALMNI